MITPNDFRLNNSHYAMKWSWLTPGQTGRLRIEERDWLNPEHVLQVIDIDDMKFRSHYQRYGFTPAVTPGIPILLRVSEQVDGEESCCFEHIYLSNVKIPIHFHINKQRSDDVWEITVTYPNLEIVSKDAYPEKMLYFLIHTNTESPEQGARFYLPRPTGAREQTFWFDAGDYHNISLHRQKDLPVGNTGDITVEKLFRIQQV